MQPHGVLRGRHLFPLHAPLREQAVIHLALILHLLVPADKIGSAFEQLFDRLGIEKLEMDLFAVAKIDGDFVFAYLAELELIDGIFAARVELIDYSLVGIFRLDRIDTQHRTHGDFRLEALGDGHTGDHLHVDAVFIQHLAHFFQILGPEELKAIALVTARGHHAGGVFLPPGAGGIGPSITRMDICL